MYDDRLKNPIWDKAFSGKLPEVKNMSETDDETVTNCNALKNN